MHEKEELRESIKFILENEFIVDEGYYSLYWANGPMGYKEGDPTPYVICCSSDADEGDGTYEEYENCDEAIDKFLEMSGR